MVHFQKEKCMMSYLLRFEFCLYLQEVSSVLWVEVCKIPIGVMRSVCYENISLNLEEDAGCLCLGFMVR